MWQLLTPAINQAVVFLINACLRTGVYPSAWKDALVTPVPKIGNPLVESDFSPISILPTVSKVFEKFIAIQLTHHFTRNNIIPDCQSGFRPGYSTTTALLKVTDDIFSATDHKLNTCLVLLDYSKAFDTINHNTLLLKLNYYGINGHALKLIDSHLRDRLQRVCFAGVLSDWMSTSMGVPQGSILGPLLFSFYTSDFSKVLLSCEPHQYADDTQLYYSFPFESRHAAATCINTDLDLISRISKAHNLTLNPSKTRLMIFGCNKNQLLLDHCFVLFLDAHPLQAVDTCKNLGLHLDTDLKFQPHVNQLLKTSFFKLRALHANAKVLTTEIKIKLCESLVISLISYCITIFWTAITGYNKASLQKVQNACLRFAYGLKKFDHITPALKHCGWLRLDERYCALMCVFIFKLFQTRCPSYLFSKLQRYRQLHGIDTRGADSLVFPKHSSALFERSFSYNAASLYFRIPRSLWDITSLGLFRREVKSFLYLRQ